MIKLKNKRRRLSDGALFCNGALFEMVRAPHRGRMLCLERSARVATLYVDPTTD